MALSKRSIEVLLDLVEIKLSCIQVLDRDDARELAALEASRRELTDLRQSGKIVRYAADRRARAIA